MTQFNEGDKVRRMTNYKANDDNGFMQIDNVYIIEEVEDQWSIKLKGSEVSYGAANFMLIEKAEVTKEETTPSFKEIYFVPESQEEAKMIQDALFEAGYTWASYPEKEYKFLDALYYSTTTYGVIQYGTYSSSVEGKQTYKVKKSYTFEPVPEVIEYNGKIYNKKEFLF